MLILKISASVLIAFVEEDIFRDFYIAENICLLNLHYLRKTMPKFSNMT